MAKKKVEVKKAVVEEVKVTEQVKTTAHTGVYAVKFTGGNIIQSNLTWDRANEKVEALEKQDKVLKGKNWTKGFYKVIKA